MDGWSRGGIIQLFYFLKDFFFIWKKERLKEISFLLVCSPQQAKLRQSKARRFFQVSPMGAGAQEHESTSFTSSGHKYGAGSKVEHSELKPEPLLDAGAIGRT